MQNAKTFIYKKREKYLDIKIIILLQIYWNFNKVSKKFHSKLFKMIIKIFKKYLFRHKKCNKYLDFDLK